MKATVLNTVTNTTKVVELPEVVTDLASLRHFIDVEDGQIFEGATHTDLVSDSQALPVLPESKKEKGYVFFVSPAQNKLKNGAYTRKECYDFIKEHKLGEAVKQEFGRNFTQVATDALNKFIDDNAEEVAPVEDTDAGKIFTEKDLFLGIIKAVYNGASPEMLDILLNGVHRVFPNPYSVQDLENMKK